MKLSNVVVTEIFGGTLLLIITFIIIALIINDFIRRQMVLACKNALQSKDKISKVAADKRTADYLKRHRNNELYRINELLIKENNVIKYKLCLKKRNFDFYLKKQRLLKYKVIAIKMY